MADGHDQSSIIGVDDDRIRAANEALVELPDHEAVGHERFFSAVRHLVDRHAQDGWPNQHNANFAAFVFAERINSISTNLDTKRVIDLAQTKQEILGNLFVLNADASNGFVVGSIDENCIAVHTIEGFKLADRPVVFAYRDTGEMTCRLGCNDSVYRTIRIRSSKPAADEDGLKSALDHFHKQEVLTPRCDPQVWKNPSQYVPIRESENVIQRKMITALKAWFRGVCRVDYERNVTTGRTDIIVQNQPVDSGFAEWAVIELKVIKSKRSTGSAVTANDNIDVCVEGMEQLISYKNDRKAPIGALEVFDLRMDKSENPLDDEKFKAKCEECCSAIFFHLRPVFGSAGDARKAGY